MSERAGWGSELQSMIVIDIARMVESLRLTPSIRMVTKQLEKEGARPTLLDPLEVNAPLLAQPLHFMVSSIIVLLLRLLNVSSSLQKDQSQAPQWMLDTHKLIQESQG